MFLRNPFKIQTKSFLKYQVLRKSTAATQAKVAPDHATDDYQYIQRSKLPTLYFQKSLIRLPIPELEKTCERYLNALKPILTKEQFNKTTNVVNKFKEGEGKELNDILRVKDSMNKHTSYISKPWFDMYLKDRSPLPLNYNPVIVFNKSIHPNAESQLCKATNLTISSLRFMKSLRKNILAPEVFHLNPAKTNTALFTTWVGLLPTMIASYGAYMMKAYPLDMSQYSSLFSSTRIPQEGKDILVNDLSGKHILILRNGHFFTLDVLDDEGNIRPAEDIFTCFKYLLEMDLKPDKESIGVLTTENRDVWARAREHMISLKPDNFQSIKAIDSALFVICLDEEPLGEDPVRIMRAFLHGDGFNRWFDKSFSLLIAKDGLSAVNFEHSWGDGVAVLRYFKDIHADVNENPFVDSDTKPSRVSPESFVRKLEFEFDDRTRDDVRTAREKFEKTCRSLGINAVEHQGLGRRVCKTAGISPDALMQLSFQVAYHKVFGNFVSTYESCSTAAFKHGRTETLRPCTEATKRFSLSVNSKNRPGKGELLEMMKECSEVHKNLTKDAAMGVSPLFKSETRHPEPCLKGFDRHLFGLKHICEEGGRELPELYRDEAYKIINYNIISTSTLAADAVMLGGFGPVVPDGYGVGYSILDNFCGSIVTSYPANRNGADFADALKTTFSELSSILINK